MDEKQKKPKPLEIRPQAGPQTEFLACSADIVFYGGAAGGGKSYGLLMDLIRHKDTGEAGAVIFRRTTPQITNQGGLWDTARVLYGPLKWEPREQKHDYTSPAGFRVKFSHLEHEHNVEDWQGSQVPIIGFDEVTHFTRYQFFYMITRNRSTSGVIPYVRATCNPDPDSWVAEFLAWWIDQEEKLPNGKPNPRYGLPIPERAGVIRWFVMVNDQWVWGDSSAELLKDYPDLIPKSVTFIPSKLSDNKILMQRDPSYLGNLLAQDKVTRARLLDGNWKIRPIAGMLFKRDYFEIIDAIPLGCVGVRYWDRAATEVKPGEQNREKVGKKGKKADWTAGCKLLRAPDGTFIIADMRREQYSPGKVHALIKTAASQDGHSIPVWVEQEPGASGVADVHAIINLLAGYMIHSNKPTTDKVTRAGPASSQCEAKNVKLLRGRWNEAFLTEAENFPDGDNDDQVDAFTGAFNVLMSPPSAFKAWTIDDD
jgi:predicted phage terminase large subunit-like protein